MVWPGDFLRRTWAGTSHCHGWRVQIEVSVDEPTPRRIPLEHLFFGMELRARKVPNVVSLAPRFIGEFEKGIDYRGDHAVFEASLREHVAIARHCGPYKISVHSGSDKFAVYPAIGRICGDLLHVKTAGTSYLEGAASRGPDSSGDLCRDRGVQSRPVRHRPAELPHFDERSRSRGAATFKRSRGQAAWLDDRVGRRLLHVTSVRC